MTRGRIVWGGLVVLCVVIGVATAGALVSMLLHYPAPTTPDQDWLSIETARERCSGPFCRVDLVAVVEPDWPLRDTGRVCSIDVAVGGLRPSEYEHGDYVRSLYLREDGQVLDWDPKYMAPDGLVPFGDRTVISVGGGAEWFRGTPLTITPLEECVWRPQPTSSGWVTDPPDSCWQYSNGRLFGDDGCETPGPEYP